MPMFDVQTVVTYTYEVEAETREDAEQAGWDYEEYPYSGEVYSIKVTEQE